MRGLLRRPGWYACTQRLMTAELVGLPQGQPRPCTFRLCGSCPGHIAEGSCPHWREPSALQVSALFHIASTNAPPPLPDNISDDCSSFLLLCFRRWASSMQLFQLPLAVLQRGSRHPLYCHALAAKPLHSESEAGSPADQATHACLIARMSWGDHGTAGQEDWAHLCCCTMLAFMGSASPRRQGQYGSALHRPASAGTTCRILGAFGHAEPPLSRPCQTACVASAGIPETDPRQGTC